MAQREATENSKPLTNVSYSFMKFMNQYDTFGQALPGFSLKRQNKISSSLGSALTLISAIVVLIYAATKASHMQSVAGQTISMYFESQDTTRENPMNLNERNFNIAFSFEKLLAMKLVNDPRYVRWIFRYSEYRDSEYYERILPHHVCTEEDLAKFYPISASSEAEYESIIEDPDRGFLCMDWDDENPF